MAKLVLLFTVVPLVELLLLVRLSALVGFGATVSLVIVTGLLGAALARHEGLRVMKNWQSALQSGRVPEEGVISGLLILVGGVLLVTPGVLTDLLGFLLLIPVTRSFIGAQVAAWVERRIKSGAIHVTTFNSASGYPDPFGPPSGSGFDSDIIDTQGETVDEPKKRDR